MKKEEPVVLVGKVASPFGIKGWVRISSSTEPLENILDYSPWQLQRTGSGAMVRQVDVAEGKLHGKGLVVRLENVADRDEAEALKGLDIAIPRSRLPALDDGSYYWTDLEGLKVENAEGEELGFVDHMLIAGAADVMAVRTAKEVGKRFVFIPFIRGEVVLSVDLQAGTIRVDWNNDF